MPATWGGREYGGLGVGAGVTGVAEGISIEGTGGAAPACTGVDLPLPDLPCSPYSTEGERTGWETPFRPSPLGFLRGSSGGLCSSASWARPRLSGGLVPRNAAGRFRGVIGCVLYGLGMLCERGQGENSPDGPLVAEMDGHAEMWRGPWACLDSSEELTQHYFDRYSSFAAAAAAADEGAGQTTCGRGRD
jgi:hypothetical protein